MSNWNFVDKGGRRSKVEGRKRPDLRLSTFDFRPAGRGALLLLAVALSACDRGSPPPPGTGSHTLTDALGRRVEVPVSARRIVSLAPNNTEILFAVGAASQVVGRDDNSDFPPQAAPLPALGATGGKLNKELMLSLRPDLVLAAEINSPEEVRSLEKLGLTTFMLPNPTSFEGLYENLLLAGRLTGHEAQADEAAAALRARVQAVAGRVRGASKIPLVFYEIDATDPQKPWTTGPGTFMHTLITLGGGRNMGAGYSRPFPRASAEEVIRSDPEVIVLGDGRFGVTADSVRRRAGWDGISAVRKGRVYVFDDDLASRPGPRLVDGLETLARLLHPELFPE